MRLMNAIGLRHKGATELTSMTVPIPVINENEFLVRIHAVGVGSHDRWFIPNDAFFPYAIGIEAAGEIVERGSAVDQFAKGERVLFGNARQPKGGTWAEFAAVVSGDNLIKMPEGLSFVDAATLPVAGGTAIKGINALDLSHNDTLFIAGASGAIGTLAIQMAVDRGYRVAASASSRNQEYLLSLGAELAVDYRDDYWVERIRAWMPDGVAAALAIQPGTGVQSLPVVKDNGKIVTVSGDNNFISVRDIHIEQISFHPATRADVLQLVADVATGKIRVVIDQIFPFERGIEALERIEKRHGRGKTVLTFD